MTPKDQRKDDRLIAKFMGLEIITDGISWFDTKYKSLKKYSEDWNALMPVVEKIMDICFNDEIFEDDTINMFYNLRDQIPDISATYTAVVDFIKWYNPLSN